MSVYMAPLSSLFFFLFLLFSVVGLWFWFAFRCFLPVLIPRFDIGGNNPIWAAFCVIPWRCDATDKTCSFFYILIRFRMLFSHWNLLFPFCWLGLALPSCSSASYGVCGSCAICWRFDGFSTLTLMIWCRVEYPWLTRFGWRCAPSVPYCEVDWICWDSFCQFGYSFMGGSLIHLVDLGNENDTYLP